MILDRYPGLPDASDPYWDRVDDDQRRLRGLRALGYWANGSFPDLPNPQDFVDPSWDPRERDAVFCYLFFGETLISWKGYSWCRFQCGTDEPRAGSGEITEEDIERLFSGEELPGKHITGFPRSPTALTECLRIRRAGPDHMGAACVSDGKYIWPEGLSHYVDKHFVRPPEEFVRHVLQEMRLRGAIG